MPDRAYLQSVPEGPGDEVDLVQPDIAFTDLPGSMWTDPPGLSEELARLRTSLIDSLRADARHLPVGTIGALQLERIATLYVQIRSHEIDNSWINPGYREWAYKTWRTLAKDFAEAGHSNKISPETLHAIVSSHTAKIVASVLHSLPREESKVLYKKFADALEVEPA